MGWSVFYDGSKPVYNNTLAAPSLDLSYMSSPPKNNNMSIWSSVIGAGGGLLSSALGGLFNNHQLKKQMEYNRQERIASQEYNTSEREASQDWQESQRIAQNQYAEDIYNQYQSPQAMYNQFLQAGLNPRLATDSKSVGNISASSGSSGGAPSGTHVNPMGIQVPQMSMNGFADGFVQMATALKTLGEAKKTGIDTQFMEDEWKERIKGMKLSNVAQELLNNVNTKYLDEETSKRLTILGQEISNNSITYKKLQKELDILVEQHLITQYDRTHWLDRYNRTMANLDSSTAVNNSSVDVNNSTISLNKLKEELTRAQTFLATQQGISESTKRELMRSQQAVYDVTVKLSQYDLDVKNGSKNADTRARLMRLRKDYWESLRDYRRARFAAGMEIYNTKDFDKIVNSPLFKKDGFFNSFLYYSAPYFDSPLPAYLELRGPGISVSPYDEDSEFYDLLK